MKKIYVIDTCRTKAWSKAFRDSATWKVIIVHEVQNWNKDMVPSQGDCVFAHTHLYSEDSEDHPDLVLVDWETTYKRSDKIQAFHAVLRECDRNNLPHIVLYSGGPLTEGTRTQWKACAVAESGPLNSYPNGLLHFLGKVVEQNITPSRLKKYADEILHTQRPEDLQVSSFGLDEALMQDAESTFAARLLMDAAKFCESNSSANCSGASIHNPPSDLLKLATTLIETSDGESRRKAAKALRVCLESINGPVK